MARGRSRLPAAAPRLMGVSRLAVRPSAGRCAARWFAVAPLSCAAGPRGDTCCGNSWPHCISPRSTLHSLCAALGDDEGAARDLQAAIGLAADDATKVAGYVECCLPTGLPACQRAHECNAPQESRAGTQAGKHGHLLRRPFPAIDLSLHAFTCISPLPVLPPRMCRPMAARSWGRARVVVSAPLCAATFTRAPSLQAEGHEELGRLYQKKKDYRRAQAEFEVGVWASVGFEGGRGGSSNVLV